MGFPMIFRASIVVAALMVVSGCATEPQSATQTAATGKKVCSEQNITGSLVQKRTYCDNEDASARNALSDAFQGASRANGGSGGQ